MAAKKRRTASSKPAHLLTKNHGRKFRTTILRTATQYSVVSVEDLPDGRTVPAFMVDLAAWPVAKWGEVTNALCEMHGIKGREVAHA